MRRRNVAILWVVLTQNFAINTQAQNSQNSNHLLSNKLFLKSPLVQNSINVFWFWYTFVVNVALLDFKNQVFQFSNKLHSFILIGDAWATRVILWRICWNYRRPVYYSHCLCVPFQISRAIYGNDIVRRIELNHRHCVALLAPMLITVILVHNIGITKQWVINELD